MRGAAGSCLECEMFVLRSAVALWQHVLNWLQMCEESKMGGLCSSRSWGCKATFTGLNWHHVSPEQGGKSRPVSPAGDLGGASAFGASTAVCLGVLNKYTKLWLEIPCPVSPFCRCVCTWMYHFPHFDLLIGQWTFFFFLPSVLHLDNEYLGITSNCKNNCTS